MTVDAHQHFWHYKPERDAWITEDMAVLKHNFLPVDLQPLLRRNKIEACVAVQADPSERETAFLIKCAQDHSFIKGVVGWTDLLSPGTQARLEYYYQFQEVKGFRDLLQDEPDSFFSTPAFHRGLALLEQYGFTYDILIRSHQLPLALQLVRKYPNQLFVVDHLGKPPVRQQQLKPWKQELQQIAMHENVYCKISGLLTEADWHQWKPEHLRPYLETALEAFGPERLMYGSDWPVCTLAASYDEQYLAVQKFIEPLSASEKKGILGANTIQFYHL